MSDCMNYVSLSRLFVSLSSPVLQDNNEGVNFWSSTCIHPETIKIPGGKFFWGGLDLSQVSSNYHGHLGPCGVDLASAEAKIRHVFCLKKVAAKLLIFAEQVLQDLL